MPTTEAPQFKTSFPLRAKQEFNLDRNGVTNILYTLILYTIDYGMVIGLTQFTN